MMYYKIINDREVFSDCKTICLEYDHPPLVKGQYVSNPDSQLILDDGWQVYVPPTPPPPGPVTEPDEWEIVQAVKKMLAQSTEELSDEDALAVAALYPTWISKVGEQVSVGERYWYNGKLYKVVQAHTVQADWTPDVSASLFTEVTIDEWPEIRVPIPSSDPYMTGDKVTFNGQHYICKMDNCVWTPAEYPSAWELVG